MKNTCLEKYGVEHAFQASEVKDKIKDTFIKNYGTTNINTTKEIRQKIKAFKKELRAEVEQKAENLENLEYKEYLKIMAKK